MVTGGSVVDGVGSGMVVLSAESVSYVETRVVSMLNVDIDVGFEDDVSKVVGWLEMVEVGTGSTTDVDKGAFNEAIEIVALDRARVVTVVQVEDLEKIDNELDRGKELAVTGYAVGPKDVENALEAQKPWTGA